MTDNVTQPDILTAYLTIGLIALVVFTMRYAGILLGTVLAGSSPKVQRVINALPGCAMAAVVAPAALRGSPTDIAAVAITFGLYLWTGRTILCLLVGVSLCILGAHWHAGSFAL